jgi:hypothetical protein
VHCFDDHVPYLLYYIILLFGKLELLQHGGSLLCDIVCPSTLERSRKNILEGKENEGRLMRLRWTLQKALLHAPRGATPSTIIVKQCQTY